MYKTYRLEVFLFSPYRIFISPQWWSLFKSSLGFICFNYFHRWQPTAGVLLLLPYKESLLYFYISAHHCKATHQRNLYILWCALFWLLSLFRYQPVCNLNLLSLLTVKWNQKQWLQKHQNREEVLQIFHDPQQKVLSTHLFLDEATVTTNHRPFQVGQPLPWHCLAPFLCCLRFCQQLHLVAAERIAQYIYHYS